MIEHAGNETKLTFGNGYSVSIFAEGRHRYVKADTHLDSGTLMDSGYYSADNLVELLKRVSNINQYTEEDILSLRNPAYDGPEGVFDDYTSPDNPNTIQK